MKKTSTSISSAQIKALVSAAMHTLRLQEPSPSVVAAIKAAARG